jgi:hypothetical protein
MGADGWKINHVIFPSINIKKMIILIIKFNVTLFYFLFSIKKEKNHDYRSQKFTYGLQDLAMFLSVVANKNTHKKQQTNDAHHYRREYLVFMYLLLPWAAVRYLVYYTGTQALYGTPHYTKFRTYYNARL